MILESKRYDKQAISTSEDTISGMIWSLFPAGGSLICEFSGLWYMEPLN